MENEEMNDSMSESVSKASEEKEVEMEKENKMERVKQFEHIESEEDWKDNEMEGGEDDSSPIKVIYFIKINRETNF